MKKLWIGISIAIVVILVGVFIVTQTKKEPEVIKIGAILPLTGRAAEFGNWMKQGLDMAAQDINKRGGIKNKKVEILYEDSQGDAKTGLSAYKKLHTINNIKFVFSSISGVTLAILPNATKDKTLVITSSTHPDITSGKYLALRIYFVPDEEAAVMADFAFNKLGIKRLGVIYLNDESLSGYYKSLKRRFEHLGGKVFGDNYDFGTTDFRTQLMKIKKWKPEALYVGGWKENGTIIRQARELGINVQILGCVTLNSPQTLETAGKSAEGVIFTVPKFNLKSPNKKLAKFRREYNKLYGKEPDVNVAIYYDGLEILAKGIEKAGMNPEEVLKYILSIKNYEGVMGTISFRPNGDIVMPIGFKKVKNGRFVWLSGNE